MADRGNTPEYWNAVWKNPKRRYEKYSMQWAWKKIGDSGAKSVLDLGCGNGRLLFGVKHNNPEVDCFGIDISASGVGKMKDVYGIDGATMSVYELDKLSRKFDFIVCNHTLEHLWRDQDVLRLSYNALNIGGHFFAAAPNNMSGPEETDEHVRKYDEATFVKLFKDVFGNCEVRIIGNHLTAIAQKKEEDIKNLFLCSHTIVRNGMPFIGQVLESVLPLVSKMYVTISEKSDDGTKDVVSTLAEKSNKIEIDYENVSSPGELTNIRQRQVDKTKEDWVLFLDDDDFWSQYELDDCLHKLSEEFNAFCVNPYQVLSADTQDANWVNKKYFTKFFRNVDINYRHPWPRDLIYKGDTLLYHKTNPMVKMLPHRFFHLAEIKHHSFRNENLLEFKYPNTKPIPLGIELPEEVRRLL